MSIYSEGFAAALDKARAEGAKEERAQIVGWLKNPCPCGEADCASNYEAIAAAVERGDHERAK